MYAVKIGVIDLTDAKSDCFGQSWQSNMSCHHVTHTVQGWNPIPVTTAHIISCFPATANNWLALGEGLQ